MEQANLFCKRLFRCFFAPLLLFYVLTALNGIGGYDCVNSAFAVRLSDSGQTTTYNNTAAITPPPEPGDPFYGQDGSYLIDPPSYTKLDATGVALLDTATSWVAVKDNVTGLVWEVKTTGNKNTTFNLANAGAYATGLTLAGRSDWRLPTLKELNSIADLRRSLPAVNIVYFNNTYFSTTKPAFYWSSDQRTAFPTTTPPFPYEWGVDFNYGYDDYYLNTGKNYVRAVSSPDRTTLSNSGYETYPSLTTYSSTSKLFDNGDGTVTDTSTGLMWKQAREIGKKTWEEAVLDCWGLVFAGYSDWRLPSLKELHSIVDYTYYDPAIDTLFFPYTELDYYWSSTTNIKGGDFNNACYLNFKSGADGRQLKSSSHYVRAVRCGQPDISDDFLFILAPARASVWVVDNPTDPVRPMKIEWEPQGITGEVKISISRDGGGTFSTIAGSIENDGYYDWIVSGPSSFNCVLKIEPVHYPSKGTTQGLFMIEPSLILPTVTTAAASKIIDISASSGGNVASNGGASVTDRGICWATFANPTISVCDPPSPTYDGSGFGSFASSITGLTPGMTYHVRAYATNSAGTGYGRDETFTTYTDTLYVSITDNCGNKTPCYSSIQTAINNAPAGSIILIAQGDYTDAGPMTLNQANTTLTLQGGWDGYFSTGQTSNTTFIKPPSVLQGTLILQMVTIR